MLEKERKRYLTIANNLYEIVEGYNYHIYDKELKFEIIADEIEVYNNFSSTLNYLYENNLIVIKSELHTWAKYSGGITPTITLKCALDLDNEIKSSVYELLKEFADKKSPEFMQQLDNAILNGHITFKEYNELYKLSKVNGGKTL